MAEKSQIWLKNNLHIQQGQKLKTGLTKRFTARCVIIVKILKAEGKEKIFFLIFKLFYCCSITVVCIFSPPVYPTPAKPTSLPYLTLPFGFVNVSFIVVPENPSPHYPFPTPLRLLLDCS